MIHADREFPCQDMPHEGTFLIFIEGIIKDLEEIEQLLRKIISVLRVVKRQDYLTRVSDEIKELENLFEMDDNKASR